DRDLSWRTGACVRTNRLKNRKTFQEPRSRATYHSFMIGVASTRRAVASRGVDEMGIEGTLCRASALALVTSAALGGATAESASQIKIETLVESTSSWDAAPYGAYAGGQPQTTVLKISIAPHTIMKWHSHPIPNAGYILSGELTIEKEDGTKKHFIAGQALSETVDSIHRGMTSVGPVVLTVFFAETSGLTLSK